MDNKISQIFLAKRKKGNVTSPLNDITNCLFNQAQMMLLFLVEDKQVIAYHSIQLMTLDNLWIVWPIELVV